MKKTVFSLILLQVMVFSCKKSNQPTFSNNENHATLITGIEGLWAGKYGLADNDPGYAVSFNLKVGGEVEVMIKRAGPRKGYLVFR